MTFDALAKTYLPKSYHIELKRCLVYLGPGFLALARSVLNMDPELQALRDARLAELKRGTQGPGGGEESGKGAGSDRVGAVIAAYLQPQALERLSRVSLVRPDRAQAVEQYLARMVSQGALSHKVTEEEIVQILHGVAREQNKKNETKIIFDRREMAVNDQPAKGGVDDDDDDDFFD